MAFDEFLIHKRSRISMVEETSYGSGGSMANDGFIPGTDAVIDPDFNQNWQEVLAAGADDRTVQDRVLGPLGLPFTLSFNIIDWRFIKLLGYSVIDAGADPYTHTFSLENTIQSFITEWAFRHTTPVVITLTGCVAKSGTISFTKATGEGGEGFTTVTMQCVAQGYSLGSSVTTLASGNIVTNPFQWRHAKLTLETNEVVELNNGEITIDQGISEADSRYANATLDRALGEPIPKTHRITSRFNVNTKDNTFATQWNSGDVLSGTNKLEFIRGANDQVVFTFASFRVHQDNTPTDYENVVSAELPCSAQSFSSLVATDSISTY